MAPEWDIGQRDVEAVERLAKGICRLPTLPGSVAIPADDPLVEGGSFRARLFLVPDRGRGLQLRIYFDSVDGSEQDRWSAWVRSDRPDRDDRTPERVAKRFRKAFQPRNVVAWEKGQGRAAPKFVRTAHWWVARDREHLQEDITAQIWLFLLQTGLTADATRGVAIPSLWNYLEHRFRLTPEESPGLLDSLLKQHWRAPTVAAWPDYVRKWVYRLPTRVERRSARTGPRAVVKSKSENFTVPQAAAALEIAQSTLYEMVRRQRVARSTTSLKAVAGQPKPMLLISPMELERLRTQLRPKPKSLIDLRQRATGSNREAARKWVRRQLQSGRSVDEITRQLSGRQTARIPSTARASRPGNDFDHGVLVNLATPESH